MWECVVNAWAWLGSNSSQVQTFIGIIALGFAVLAYFKVLKQIKISDRQTNLTIQQMTKYNEERVFELRLRLKIRIGEHSKALMELQDAANDLSLRLQALSIDTKENHPESLDAIEDMIKIWRGTSIQSVWDIIGEKIKENNDYLQKIATTKDISFMEEILDKVEQNQVDYEFKMREIRNLDAHVTKIWIPMNMGVMEAIRTMHNFK